MPSIAGSDIHKLVVACDAGMGSSVMLASTLRKQLKATAVTVEHTPGQHDPGRRRRGGLPRRSRRPGPGVRARQGDRAVPGLHRRPGGHAVVNAIKNGGTVNG